MKIFVQYQGDDARQGGFSKENYKINFADFMPNSYYNPISDSLKKMRADLISKLATKVYALNPDLMNVLPSKTEFLPYSHIDLVDWPPVFNQMESRKLRVGHAPSNRLVKGTDFIISAIASLHKEGFDIELILVEGLENKVARDVYATVDILVDQLFAGWYGGLAVEAMALGKPVVAYLREDDLKYIPMQMKADLPIVQATSASIYDVLKTLVLMPRPELLKLAQKSRRYVERWHDADLIAKRIKNDMELATGSSN